MTAARGTADEGLGAQVRAARTAKGVSLRGLARALEVSPATLSQIENGRTGLSVSRLSRIAEVLGLTVPQILDTVVAPGAPPSPVRSHAAADPSDGRTARPTIADWRTYDPLDFDPVLRAALDEFLAIGYHGATVRGIAARAGLSVSGLYHHYTSKQQMLVTILDLTMAELLLRARAARAEGRNPVQRFSLLVEHLALYHTHRRELGFVGAAEMRALDADNRRKIACLRITQQRMVDHEVEDAVSQGWFRADHPHEAARAVVTMCTALPTWWRPDGPLSPEQVAEQYVGFALDLMRHRRPS
ncbi:TetR family transcriptional regulator [Pseudonocardia sp.]|uniref:TetR family transcriptional regulator n=1 Tax=Pseudonocardia sp. TaxID=60912 RepID=UPI003D0F50F2